MPLSIFLNFIYITYRLVQNRKLLRLLLPQLVIFFWENQKNSKDLYRIWERRKNLIIYFLGLCYIEIGKTLQSVGFSIYYLNKNHRMNFHEHFKLCMNVCIHNSILAQNLLTSLITYLSYLLLMKIKSFTEFFSKVCSSKFFNFEQHLHFTIANARVITLNEFFH